MQHVATKRRVLVVDDDPQVRHAIARTLSPDFDVLQADSYAEALGLLSNETKIHAVVCDYNLGRGATGANLLEKVRERLPQARRVLTSAQVAKDVGDQHVQSGLIHVFLEKPWTLDALRAAVRADTMVVSDI